jgi:hypothetical protein
MGFVTGLEAAGVNRAKGHRWTSVDLSKPMDRLESSAPSARKISAIAENCFSDR